jgi:hypothetical protein
MSLARRLSAVQPNHANAGCRTCRWLATLTDADRQAWDQWLADGKSGQQLYEIARDEGLDVSLTAFRHHCHHKAQ